MLIFWPISRTSHLDSHEQLGHVSLQQVRGEGHDRQEAPREGQDQEVGHRRVAEPRVGGHHDAVALLGACECLLSWILFVPLDKR